MPHLFLNTGRQKRPKIGDLRGLMRCSASELARIALLVMLTGAALIVSREWLFR